MTKDFCPVKVYTAMTKINQLYQIQDLIPMKFSLEAAQKKFKCDEFLMCS